MTNLKRNILAATIILSGLVLRLYKIDQPILEYFPQRQTQTAEITRNIYANGWPDFWIPKIRYEKGYLTPLVLELPIYNSITAGLYVIFGPNLILGRLVSIFAFLISSIFFALIILKHSDKNLLFSALLVFAFSPLHVLVSRSYQPDELALMLLLISVYYSSYFFLMLSGFIKLPFYLFGLIFTLKKHAKIRLGILKYLIFFVPIFVWSIRASMIMKDEGYSGAYAILNWFDPLFFLDYRFYTSVFNILHINVLTTLGLLFFIIGLFYSWRKKSMALWKMWLFASILYAAFFNRHVSTHEYYSLPFVPPLAAFTGAGMAALFKSIDLKNITLRKFFILSILLLLTLALIIPSLTRIHNFDFKSVNPILIERYNELF